MDIDKVDFDSESAFYELITSHTLEELLSLENNLSSEIRTLDGNMQTLVYENYNKFISATDTIKSMKSNVEKMEDEMKRLEESMSKIQGLTEKVDGVLGLKQQEIKKLVGIHEELQKIKFICDLPALLRSAIENNSDKNKVVDFHQAAESYHDSQSFLQQHKTDTSYASIYQETMECTETIKKILWSKLQDSNLPAHLFTKYIKEMAWLGDESEKLPTLFFNYHKSHIISTLKKLYEKATLSAKSTPIMPMADSYSSIQSIDQDIRVNINETDREYSIKEGSFSWYILEVHEQGIPQFVNSLVSFNEIFSEKQKNLMINYVRDVLTIYINNIKNKLKEVNSELGPFTKALHIVNSDMKQIKALVASSSQFSVSDKFSELFEFTIRHEVEKVIENLQGNLVNFLENISRDIENSTEGLPESIEGPTDKAVYDIMYSVIASVIELEPLIESSKSYLTSGIMFVSLIVSHLIQFFQFFKQAVSSFSSRYAGNDPSLSSLYKINKSGTFLIALLKISISLEENGLPKLLSTISSSYSDLGISKPELNDIIQRVAKPELLITLKQTQEDLLTIYIEHYGKLFSDMLEEYANINWLIDTEPIDVHPIIVQIIENLKIAKKELKVFFRGEQALNQRFKRKRAKHNVELEMERLFARKAKTYENVKFELNSILSSIVKLTFKSMYEELRMKEFGTGGVQQIEVDSSFMGSCIDEIVAMDDNDILSGYVHEVNFTVSNRSTQPVSLQKTLLESIVENKKEQLNIKSKS
ncbi:unnamed protein product [Blepharisma stoltei]|uniref:Vacuolar protein sorting-associated protein 51 homolog n=1 Tax=Blepharisma stoltei TaxID=1481888 RepID=A0AAU9JED0_9CILI|nr:unnamed protein product [Blepharisma stoltei]